MSHPGTMRSGATLEDSYLTWPWSRKWWDAQHRVAIPTCFGIVHTSPCIVLCCVLSVERENMPTSNEVGTSREDSSESSTFQRTLHVLTLELSQWHYNMHAIINPILQMGMLSPRKCQYLSGGYIANIEQRSLIPIRKSNSTFCVFTTVLICLQSFVQNNNRVNFYEYLSMTWLCQPSTIKH